MGEGIGEVLALAIGVAISPLAVVAVILMLFSRRAKVNGPLFLAGWVIALGVVSTVVYLIEDESSASTSSDASDAISWLKILLGVLLLFLAARTWRSRPAPGGEPDTPRWMGGMDTLSPGKALGLGVVLAGVKPKNLILAIGAASNLAQLGVSTGDAVVSILVFVFVGSLTIAVPVVYYLVGGARAQTALDELKSWLVAHNAAIMIVLFLVFGVVLIAKGLPPLTG
jgi:Sap, sulfolipid-1-addressing protein